MAYLMWQYKQVNTGVIHIANTAAQRTKMLGKGYADVTGWQSWALPYPTGKGSAEAVAPPPAPVITEPPAETLPEPEVVDEQNALPLDETTPA